MMDTHMDGGEDPDLLSVIDDACVCAVLAQLPTVQDLLVASAACKRLHSAARTSTLWIKHVYSDFGIQIHSQSPAAAGTSAHTEERSHQPCSSAMLLYKQLVQAQLRPRALPAEALCTDGGCDEPYYAYWAGNMFVPKRSIMYCSDSNTRNVHVFARLCPDSAAMQEQQQQYNNSAPQPAPAGAMQDRNALPLQQQQQQHDGSHVADARQNAERRRREFLLNRCPYSAKHLISPEVVARYHPQQQQQQDESGSRGGVMQRLYRHMGWGGSSDVKLAAATEALRTCSTEGLLLPGSAPAVFVLGLAQFFIAAYMGQQLSTDWSLALFSNLNDEQIQHVHEVAFSLWTELADNPAQHKFLQLPMSPLPVMSNTAAAAAGASSADMQHSARLALSSENSRTVGSSATHASRGQQLVEAAAAARPETAVAAAAAAQHLGMRQLLCDEHQLCALSETTSPGQHLCVVSEMILVRDDGMAGNSSTCPVGSGMVFLGHYQHSGGDAVAAAALDSSSHSTPLPPLGSDARAAVDAAATATPAARHAAAVLAAMTRQPWISASNDLTTATAVMTASTAGLLPPMADYVQAGAAEYIEFEKPDRQQLQQQQQEWARLAGRTCQQGSSCGSWSAASFLVPVVWFRFPQTPNQADDDDDGDVDDDEDIAVEGDADDAVGELGEPPALLAQGPQHDHAPSSDSDGGIEPDEAEPSEELVSAEEQLSSGGRLYTESPASSARVVTAAAEERQAGRLVAADLSAAGTSSAAATDAAAAAAHTRDAGSAATALAIPLQARAVPAHLTCPRAETLPAAATEVAAALGWLPSWEHHPRMIYIPLSRPRAANLMCVKLLDCEDLKPAFNRSRGGCNIDMQLVMLRGTALGKLPAGLTVAPLGEWHV